METPTCFYTIIKPEKISFDAEISSVASKNKVFRATWRAPSGKQTVAAKCCSRFHEEEVLIMARMNHKNIIKLLGVVKPASLKENYIIVTEYAERGSLYNVIQQHRENWPEFRQNYSMRLAQDGARALQYIHDTKYQHGDVKSPNFLVTSEDVLKICDFGISRQCEYTISTVTNRGSYPWMAPEALGDVGTIYDSSSTSSRKPCKVTTKSDVYSFGVVIWELISGKAPYPDKQLYYICKAVVEKGERLEIPHDCPEHQQISDLLNKCWQADYVQRPNMQEVLENLICIEDGWKKTSGKQEVDGKWEMCHEFGKKGSGPGEFNGATSITATQMSDIAVIDCCNKQVVISSNEGQHKESIPLQSYPLDIAAIHNHDNQLVVVDDTKYVKVFDKKNKLAFQFPTVPQSEVDKTEVNLQSVAVRKDGTILVGDVERMVWTEHRPTDGQLLHTVPVQTPPYFLSVDHCTNTVVVSGLEINRVRVYVAAGNGATLSTINPTTDTKCQRVQRCRGVCCDRSGIYITVCNAADGTGHIHHYDLDGVFLACLARGLQCPYGITFTSDRQLAIADWESVKMYHKWRTSSKKKKVAAKCCSVFHEKEVLIMARMSHRNIIELLGVVKPTNASESHIIVTEYAERGSLYKVIEKHREDWPEFRQSHWMRWAQDGAKALQYIHQMGYQHGDVKSPNFLVTSDNILKICDFGISRKCEYTISTVTNRGSYPWMAPEALGDLSTVYDPSSTSSRKPCKVTTKSDVYSFGVVIWELISGKAPYPDKQLYDICKAVVEKGERLEIPHDCPENQQITDLLNKCWQADYAHRPNMQEVLEILICIEDGWKKTAGRLEVEVGKWEMCCEFGKKGRGTGEFDGARSIVVTGPGEIAVVDCWNNRAVICSDEGQHKENIPLHSCTYPCDIATIHNHDNQWVVVDHTKYVKVFSEKKLVLHFPTVPQSKVDKMDVNLQSVAVRKNGTILVGDVKRMVWTEHRPTDGQLLHTVTVQTPPYFLAVDDYTNTGRVVVSGGDKQRFDVAASNGKTLAHIKPTIHGCQVQHCCGACYGDSGIFITVSNELGTGHIHHYDRKGVFLACLAQGLFFPQGITFKSDGQLAVADQKSVKMYQKV
ncbi:uncharacterized protein LOC110989886 [Acanthaster planci]|uniref:Uncharacterized protein LOC110989886 n=1 Tax=Acanthaster planci TaxID=133434 RepID=A0A8B7ZXJ6_ACAPL|nr:uncharacterized protein LOC110989886 [Acanthaster planci]